MRVYKITLTDNTDLVFDVYVEAVDEVRAREAVATAGLFVANVQW